MEILKISLNTFWGLFTSVIVAFEKVNEIIALLVGMITVVYFFFQIRKIYLDIRIKKEKLRNSSHGKA